MKFLDEFDLTFSYAETAGDDARRLYRDLSNEYVIYEYSQWLVLQSGLQIEAIAQKLYSSLPSIIFVTADWYCRPATQLEQRILETNPKRKLVIDYEGDFLNSCKHALQNFELCPFKEDDLIDLSAVRGWLLEVLESNGYDVNG